MTTAFAPGIAGRFVLVLSGGNALGAYHAGAYEALAEHGLHPDHIVGTSIGAITGAIIAGNLPESRVERLRAFWRKAQQVDLPFPTLGGYHWERWLSGLRTLVSGRPGLFLPDLFHGWPIANDRRRGLLNSRPTHETLRELVDFEYLNDGPSRLTVVAVDAETGEEVVFDTSAGAIGPDHLLASAAMPVLFEPVEVDGRWLVDGGMSANLPLRLALREPPGRDTLCIALDLLPARGRVPQSIGEAALRAQDLIFSCQSRSAIAALQREHRLRRGAGKASSAQDAATTVLHLAYGGGDRETAIKPLDFAPDSIRARWNAGKSDMVAALGGLAGTPAPQRGAFSVFGLQAGGLTPLAEAP